jgi:hypothetical protein
VGTALGVLVLAGALALLLAGLAWLGRRARRGGTTGSVISIFDEIWHPARHETHIEVQRQVERRAPSALPGDPPSITRSEAHNAEPDDSPDAPRDGM